MIKATSQPYSSVITMYNTENAKFQTVAPLRVHIDSVFVAEYDMELDGIDIKKGDVILVIPQYNPIEHDTVNKYIIVNNIEVAERLKYISKKAEELDKKAEENIKAIPL